MPVPHQRYGDPICSSEMGTRIFAILNLIIAIGFSLSGTVGMAYLPQILAVVESNRTHDGSLGDKRATFNLLTHVMLMLTGTFMAYISLVFAALLVCGFFKKTPGYLKAYLCYGVFVEIVSAIAVAVSFIPEGNGTFVIPISASASAIALLVIYALILVMIRITYKKYVDLELQYNPQAMKAPEREDN